MRKVRLIQWIGGVGLVLAMGSIQSTPASDIHMCKDGWVRFLSEAPLETIEAENDRVGAVLDIGNRTVAFEVPITAFEGFNSALQHEHFNENYMEVDLYPKSLFNGKIIEEVDLSQPGSYKVRAKGMLSIHGVEKERIISGNIKVMPESMTITSKFEVPLVDHEIMIPRIVNQKIAEIIQVEVKATLKPRN